MKASNRPDKEKEKHSHRKHTETVAKGVKESREKVAAEKRRKGSSNEGKYKHVAPEDFAGSKGGASAHSYPINTRKRAKAALAYAHNAPNPEGIRRAVHSKYPTLGEKKKK